MAIKFTQQEKEEIINSYVNGDSAGNIARNMHVSSQTICRRLQQWGFNTSPYYDITEEDNDSIIELYEGGMSAKEIGGLFGASESSALRWLNDLGINTSKRFTYTKEEAIEMIGLYEDGWYISEIANEFNVSPPTIGRILRSFGVDTAPTRYEVNHNFFNKLDTENKKYWFAFICGDGSLEQGSLIRIRLCTVDIDHLQKFLGDLNSNYKIYTTRNNTSCAIKITSRQMFNDLVKYGLHERKSLTLEPYAPLVLDKDHWRGYIDSDGWISRKKRRGEPIIGLCGTKAVCEGFKIFCQSLSPTKANVGSGGDNLYRYVVSGYNAIPIIYKLYHSATVYLTRKKLLADKILREAGWY